MPTYVWKSLTGISNSISFKGSRGWWGWPPNQCDFRYSNGNRVSSMYKVWFPTPHRSDSTWNTVHSFEHYIFKGQKEEMKDQKIFNLEKNRKVALNIAEYWLHCPRVRIRTNGRATERELVSTEYWKQNFLTGELLNIQMMEWITSKK